MAARGREEEVLDLKAAELEARVGVAALARVDAVVAERANVLVDDEDSILHKRNYFALSEPRSAASNMRDSK